MIRVAVLGAGIGREHIRAYRALPETFDLAVVIDKDPARIEHMRGADGVPASATVEDALNDPGIDLIDVCLPPHLHVPITLQALAAGKHVICEKPLATSMSDVDKLKAAAGRSGKSIFPVFQYRWGPSFAKLRALIDAGFSGAPQAASIETHWARDAEYYAVGWRGTWAGEQGGAVLGHAIHAHDLMTHFMGPVAAVSAMTATRINPIETEDCAAISFEMCNGALATSSITLGAASNETRLRLVFEHLTATSGSTPYAPGSAPWSFRARNSDRQSEIDNIIASARDERIGFEGFLTEVGKTLDGIPAQAPTLEDGAASVALVTAIYHAARSGARVHLPLAPDHELYQGWCP